MHNSQAFDWLTYLPTDGSTDIKVELQNDFSLLSPPTSPFLSTSEPSLSSPSVTNQTLPTSLGRRHSTTSPKRVRPYSVLPRESRYRTEQNAKSMASTPAYGPWGRGGHAKPNERRSSDGEQAHTGFAPTPVQHYGRDPRPQSSSSSLIGAMGDARLSSSHSHTRSPPPGGMYDVSMNQGTWMSPAPAQPLTVASHPSAYPGVAGNNVSYHPSDVESTYYRNSPESLSPPSPFTTPTYTDAYRNYAGGAMTNPTASTSYAPTSSPAISSSLNPQEEIRQLRRRVHQLEQEKLSVEAVLATRMQQSSRSGLPTPPQFQASWRARTDARIRLFCSLNRAGNALCSWHDSRRERRIHPPRMAPAGVLNCGCTYEEALFEESLARWGVGSYLPGENVRMDPALRNPLLKLLQDRYNYRDGDFERDPRTGDWTHGEGPANWEQQAQAGHLPRRTRPDEQQRR